jgi:hypothetical protein
LTPLLSPLPVAALLLPQLQLSRTPQVDRAVVAVKKVQVLDLSDKKRERCLQARLLLGIIGGSPARRLVVATARS